VSSALDGKVIVKDSTLCGVYVESFFSTSAQGNPCHRPQGIDLKTTSLSINHQWQSVDESFSLDSVLFYSAPTNFGKQRGVVRMRQQNNQAQFRFQEWSNLDGGHAFETINVVSVPTGTWSDLDNSRIIKVGTVELSGTGQWKVITFYPVFTNPPAVVASLQTSNGGDAVDVRVRNVTTTSMQVALFEEEQKMGTGHVPETVAYLAVETTSDGIDLLNSEAERLQLPFQASGVSINHSWTSIADNYQLRLEEDRSRDQEVFHALETIHVIKIDDIYLTQIASSLGADPAVLRSRNDGQTGPVIPSDPVDPIEPPDVVTNNQVSGFVWLDTNADGLQSDGEPGFAQTIPDFGAPSVALYPQGSEDFIDSAHLDENSNGRYLFSHVPDGNYYVCVSDEFLQLGLSVTIQNVDNDFINSDFDNSPCTYAISVAGGQIVHRDLGLTGGSHSAQTGEITVSSVFVDYDGDGILEGLSPGAIGVKFGLYSAQHSELKAMEISSQFHTGPVFNNLSVGDYMLCAFRDVVVDAASITRPVAATIPNVGSEFRDSDFVVLSDGRVCTETITITADQPKQSVALGLSPSVIAPIIVDEFCTLDDAMMAAGSGTVVRFCPSGRAGAGISIANTVFLQEGSYHDRVNPSNIPASEGENTTTIIGQGSGASVNVAGSRGVFFSDKFSHLLLVNLSVDVAKAEGARLNITDSTVADLIVGGIGSSVRIQNSTVCGVFIDSLAFDYRNKDTNNPCVISQQ
jgi:hypothetical protein